MENGRMSVNVLKRNLFWSVKDYLAGLFAAPKKERRKSRPSLEALEER
jgi:hypothetical protein